MAGKSNPTFDTPLDRLQERQFQDWRAQHVSAGNIHPMDLGQDYDMRGAFKAGVKPDNTKHWPDTYKKPNHPTFSNESIYSSLVGTTPGVWTGIHHDQYQGFDVKAHQEQQLNSGPFLQAKQLAQHWLDKATTTVKGMKPGYNLSENSQLDTLNKSEGE